MRVFAISDLHVDFKENGYWVKNISNQDYRQDALILAGDVSHEFDELSATLEMLLKKFKMLFFVPGNHELWLNNGNWQDSWQKLQAILDFCEQCGVHYKPLLLEPGAERPLWVVPLLSWYTQPDEGEESLYLHKPGEDSSNRMWSDNYYIKWPNANAPFNAARSLTSLNKKFLPQEYDAPVLSFSHFLPRQELMFRNGIKPDLKKVRKYDRNPSFNFSRVAGSMFIDQQIRQVGSEMHIYGHQHINRDLTIDGVRYIANSLGYPAERQRGQIKEAELMQVWDCNGEKLTIED